MFRKMRRFKQEISSQECIRLLKNETRGVLSVIGDDGYPYGVPINFYYDEKNNKIYFHGAKSGHKLDAIRRCDKVSFCTHDEGVREGDDWPLHVKSVIIFGRIKEISDPELSEKMCRRLAEKFTDDVEYIDKEISGFINAVNLLELTIEHMSGKKIKES